MHGQMSAPTWKRLIIAGVLVLVCALVGLLALPRGYTHQGRTVEEWFREFATSFSSESHPPSPEELQQFTSSIAFAEMGTNAVPFLAGRITRDLDPSRLEVWAGKLPRRIRHRPVPKSSDATLASVLLVHCVKPPGDMLSKLLEPVLCSSNAQQRMIATYALYGPTGKKQTNTLSRQQSTSPSSGALR